MKRSLEVAAVVILSALVFSKVGDNQPEATPPAAPKLYQCAHRFGDPKADQILLKAYQNSESPASLPQFDQLIARYPDNPVGYYHKADALDDQGRPLEAITIVTRAIELEPGFATALYLRAYCREQLEDPIEWEAGLDDIDRAIALDPDGTNYDVRSCLLLKLDRPREALAAAVEAVKLEPDEPEFLRDRAAAQELLGNGKEAALDRQLAARLEASH